MLKVHASPLCLRRPPIFLVAMTLIFFAGASAFAGSGIWVSSPISGDWNSAFNWLPITVPNGPADTATFESSLVPDVSISTNTEVNGIVFNPLAHLTPFTITAAPTRTLTVGGLGITNKSGVTQNFVTTVDVSGNFGTLVFRNNATAGSMTRVINTGATPQNFNGGGLTQFESTSTAGSATINNNAGRGNDAAGGRTNFNDASTAGSAKINNKGGVASFAGGGFTQFQNTSTGG